LTDCLLRSNDTIEKVDDVETKDDDNDNNEQDEKIHIEEDRIANDAPVAVVDDDDDTDSVSSVSSRHSATSDDCKSNSICVFANDIHRILI
jgi:hypothetical protein